MPFSFLLLFNSLFFVLFSKTEQTMISRLLWPLVLLDLHAFLVENTNEEKRNGVRKKSKSFVSNAVEKYPNSSDQGDYFQVVLKKDLIYESNILFCIL